MRVLMRGWLGVAALAIASPNCGGSTSIAQGADGSVAQQADASVEAAAPRDGVDDLDTAMDQQSHDAASPEDTGAGDSQTASDSSTASDATVSDSGSCTDQFATAVDKKCTSVIDCTTANHNDCCGTIVVGIRAGTQATFAAAEQAFQTCVPGCGLRGCFHADMAEDQSSTMSMDGTLRAIVVRCDSGRCMTHVQ